MHFLSYDMCSFMFSTKRTSHYLRSVVQTTTRRLHDRDQTMSQVDTYGETSEAVFQKSGCGRLREEVFYETFKLK